MNLISANAPHHHAVDPHRNPYPWENREAVQRSECYPLLWQGSWGPGTAKSRSHAAYGLQVGAQEATASFKRLFSWLLYVRAEVAEHRAV